MPRHTSAINNLDKGRPSAAAADRRPGVHIILKAKAACIILLFASRKFHFSPEGSLIVFNASYPDAGAYECVADNGRQGGRKTARKDN